MPEEPTGLVAEALHKPEEDLTDDAIARVAEEILDPSNAVPAVVSLGGRDWPVVMLKWGRERRFTRIIGPHLRFLIDAAAIGQLENAVCASLTEADVDLTTLALVILQLHDPAIDEAWLEENATFDEILTLVTAQIQKNKIADSLGKLWGPGVLAAKVLKGVQSTLSLPSA